MLFPTSFRFLEASVGAGLRRIEAVTGREAYRLIHRRLAELDAAAALLSCRPEQVQERVAALGDTVREQERAIAQLRRQMARQDFEGLLSRVQEIDGVPVLAARVDAASMETLREMTDWFRDKMGSGVVVLGAVMEEKPNFVAAVTSDLVDKGLHAGKLIQATAKIVGGGGGGRPTLAQAGGRDAAKLDKALDAVQALVKESIV
jgi:alanyl-tRNA synthetase